MTALQEYLASVKARAENYKPGVPTQRIVDICDNAFAFDIPLLLSIVELQAEALEKYSAVCGSAYANRLNDRIATLLK